MRPSAAWWKGWRLWTGSTASIYGEEAGGGLRGGRQGPLEAGGSDYLNEHYPLLDFIVSARVERD